MKKVWIVEYALGTGCLVHSMGFKTREKAEAFKAKMAAAPYVAMYETEDIWNAQ